MTTHYLTVILKKNEGRCKKINTRLRELRNKLGLSREDFAKRLGLKSRGKIENIELSRTKPDDAFIHLICREFSVNEHWLRTGEGEMFIKLTKEEEIASFIGEILSDEDDSFKKRLISGLAALDENGWTVLENFLNSIQKKED